MKKKSTVTVLLTLLALVITFSTGCKKDDKPESQQPSLTKEQILVQKTWKVDQLHHVIDGEYSSYIDGGANTTNIPYEKLRFTFKEDGTGTHVDQSGVTHNFTWQFSTSDKRNITLNVSTLTPSIFNWEMVEIAGKHLHASVRLTINENSNNIETFRLIQM